MKILTLKLIQFYRNTFSPFSKSCRFTPTCSEYTYQSVAKYGTIRGLFMGFKRILRCNPWGGKGFDPVK